MVPTWAAHKKDSIETASGEARREAHLTAGNPQETPRVEARRDQGTVTRTGQIDHQKNPRWSPGEKDTRLQVKERTGSQNKSPSGCGLSKRPRELGRRWYQGKGSTLAANSLQSELPGAWLGLS